MKFSRTQELVDQYAQALITQTITDEQLLELESLTNFANITQGDQKHTTGEAIHDFVMAIGNQINQKQLNELVQHLIDRENDIRHSSFMRADLCLAKHFLAFEMWQFPDNTKSHFESAKYQDGVHKQGGIETFNNVIMMPVRAKYDPAIKVQLDQKIADQEAELIKRMNATNNPGTNQASRADHDFDTPLKPSKQPNGSVPASFFLRMVAHPGFKIAMIILLFASLTALTVGSFGLGGLGLLAGAGVGAAVMTGIGAGVTGLGVAGLISSFRLKCPPNNENNEKTTISLPESPQKSNKLI